MQLKVNASHMNTSQVLVVLNKIPDKCPLCHKNIDPKIILHFIDDDEKIVQSVFNCTSKACESIFIGYYLFSSNTTPKSYVLRRTAPTNIIPITFSQTIEEVSPTFVLIYNQAIHAEAVNLNEIVGIGLRKALEFLIKDFAIAENPSQADDIKKLLLGNCINTYINDVNVKECAKRAAWLGNDETHYIRKWEDKDISDMKLLIRLTVNWIENVILTQKYISEM